MFAQVEHPAVLLPEELDDYLALGWFRMGQTIFTTNFLNFNKLFYSAIWLRIDLEVALTDNVFKKLKKLNAAFRVEILPAVITEEKEELYATYKTGINFSASHSILDLLLEGKQESIFNTHEVNLYDGDKLIACGYFDIGQTSAAGITSFFDPAYKKYSLGKYLIYLKIAYCRDLKLHYFYPGYFAPGYSKFDYKLEIGKASLQYFHLTEQKWLHINEFDLASHPHIVMTERLKQLSALLIQNEIQYERYNYEYYNANLIPNLCGLNLFDYPVFLKLTNINTLLHPLIVFDVRDMHFHFMLCDSLVEIDYNNGIDGYYGDNLLKIEQFIFSSETTARLLEIVDLVTLSNNQKF